MLEQILGGSCRDASDINQPCLPESLVSDLTHLIAEARTRAAVAVNAEITALYWHVGRRIRIDVLKEERADYGKQILLSLSEKLTLQFGYRWSDKQLRHCLRFAEAFEDESIVYALRRELSWTHIRTIIYIDDPLKRSFYMELYLRWLAKHEQQEGEALPLGIILCAGKKQDQIGLLELGSSGIHVAEYLTALPDKGLLEQKLHQAIVNARQRFIEGDIEAFKKHGELP